MPDLELTAPLRHRPFRLLFLGQVVSDIGDWLDLLALLTLIAYQWRLGAPALAALTLVTLLPWAVSGPFAGVLVDRWPRKRVMIVCDLLRAAVVLGLVWAPNLVIVLTLVALKFTLSTFFAPARLSAIRSTVPMEDLLPATSLSRLSVNTTKVLGPSLGGVLVALTGPRGAFFIDSLTFLCSASLLSMLTLPSSATLAATASTSRRFWREFREGITSIAHCRVLLILVGVMTAEMILVEASDSLFVLALKGLGMSAALVGLTIGSSGIGNVAGAAAIGQWGKRVLPFRLLGTGTVLVGAVTAAIGGGLILGLGGSGAWIPVIILAGIGFACIWVPCGFLVQSETPEELIGRVSATAIALQTGFGLLGPPLGAVLAQRFGVGPVFVSTGIALILLGAGVLLVRPSRRTAASDPDAAPG
ncbi:MAG: MFS transporter [Dehalococcoidia bacterium]